MDLNEYRKNAGTVTVMKNLLCFITIIFAMTMASCGQDRQESGNTGKITGDYFGQAVPGDSARLFAPGIISTGMDERDFAITPDGNEIFFCR